MSEKIVSELQARPVLEPRIGSGCWSVDLAKGEAITLERDSHADMVLMGVGHEGGALSLTLEPYSRLNIVELVDQEGAAIDLRISLLEGAECTVTQVVTASSNLRVEASLDGRFARFELGGAFILSANERGTVQVDVRHNVADCSSRTTFKGVASQSAQGKFSGLVYVAPDAQRTDSEQLSRNITLGQARIETLPQLEIYADDVKCSHGATVGQMNDEAVLYMRQRGLSLATAKRLQIEGFVSDVVLRSSTELCREAFIEALESKLEKL